MSRRFRKLVIAACIVSAVSVGAAFAHGEVERFVDVAATLFGHPVHPMLVVFPLGLLPTALLFDLIYLAKRDDFWRRAAFWATLVGVVGGLGAAAFGFADYFLALPQTGELRADATAHWIWAAAALGVALIGLVLRGRTHASGRSRLVAITLLSAMAVVFVVTAGFHGGHLVYNERVGVARPEHYEH